MHPYTAALAAARPDIAQTMRRLRAIPGRPLSAFEAPAQECAISQRKEIAGMFQVHLVCRHGESDRLVGLLTTDAGVRNIVVLPASARRPDGDLIQFDLAAGSADPDLRQLRDLDIGERSPVAVHIVDAALPELLPSARRGRRRRLGEIAPVWELLYARIRADAVYARASTCCCHRGPLPDVDMALSVVLRTVTA